jgi:5'-nucleotidase
MPKGICLNVNAPQGEIKGIQICRQSSGRWSDEFKKDDAPRSVPYFWLIGDFLNDTLEAGEHPHVGDQKAMEEGYVSIVPIHTDMTAYHVMSSFKGYETIR